MKTKSLYLAALMVIAVAATAVGKDEPRQSMAVVAVKGSETFKVIYKGESSSKVKLSVYNSASQIVFSETLSNVDGFIRPLNFNGLQFGEYTIELTDASGKKVEKINYQPARSASKVHISKIANVDGQFLVSVAKTTSETIIVKIYDEQNNLIHTESKAVAGDFAQLFTVKDLSGAVTFEVLDNAGSVKTVAF